MSELTPRQQQVYQFVCDYLDSHGYAPTLQEIAAYLGINGNLGVLRHLEALEKKGYLRRVTGKSRGIVLSGRSTSQALPVVGSVAAGALSEALEDVEDYLNVDPALIRGDGSFVLRVRGDSMLEAQICDGDLAIIHPQPEAENGDIVVARLDGEATLKRFFREGESIRLQPENSRFQPIFLSAEDGDVAIIGKVTAIIRLVEEK